MMNKVFASATDAVADIGNGASLAVGGFGLSGLPSALIEAVLAAGVGELVTVSNNCGVDDFGLGMLLREKRIARTSGSYVGENKEFARQLTKMLALVRSRRKSTTSAKPTASNFTSGRRRSN